MARKGWIKAYELPSGLTEVGFDVDKHGEAGDDVQEGREYMSDSRLDSRLPSGSGRTQRV